MLHENRTRAESFGGAAALYHRARPRYPAVLIDHLMGDGTPSVLDVGCGTGIAAGLLAARGCAVLGVEVDERMATVAREQGTTVEIGRFEDWDPHGRTFDLLTCGQAWHWVAPRRGVEHAAQVLAPGGRIALFWNFAAQREPALSALAEVYRRLAPELGEDSVVMGTAAADRLRFAAADLRRSGRFAEPVVSSWRWDLTYTAAQWVELLLSHSDHATLETGRRDALMAAVAGAIEGLGGEIVAEYATQLVEARLK